MLLIIFLLSGATQFYFIHRLIEQETRNQASMVASSVNNGVQETLVASAAIEHQIDLKLVSYARHISEILKDTPVDQITEKQLQAIQHKLQIAGITLFAAKGDDVVGIASTDPQEVGFSMRKIGFYEAAVTLLAGGKPPVPGATLLENNIIVLPIAQSATHEQAPTFYKFAYYHPLGESYGISLFIEANEVNQFTSETGPDAWMSKIRQDNAYVAETAILTPKVYVDPSLENNIYPPVKKVVSGEFRYQSAKDERTLKQMAEHPTVQGYTEQVEGRKLYKAYVPMDSGQVIYIALDEGKISNPLYRNLLISILFSFLSLLALFMLTARFFTQIYKSIQKIISQIKELEQGNLTIRSHLKDKGELGDLSGTVNTMAESLHQLLRSTYDHATIMQRMSVMLEAEADQSVDKALYLSINATTEIRSSTAEIEYILELMKERVQAQLNETESNEIVQHIDEIRNVIQDKTNSATVISITLSDLLKSLHKQSSELSERSQSLLKKLGKFKFH
ncbi:HAMP domain-containing protein [Paenibacillus barcinonensis]|uniref:HAMP domain-containing protein n=1 Tax=Paenibacillus barcinonensis TaxID=198119 RepID=UPI001ABF9493|nr:HAMP domain-containing protein [Paenibacillus barcinonensis]